MQEILGGSSRANTSGPTSSQHMSSSLPPTHTKRDHDRDVSRVQTTIADDYLRNSRVLREHDATLRIVPERAGTDNTNTHASVSVEHGTLYKQHFSGLEVGIGIPSILSCNCSLVTVLLLYIANCNGCAKCCYCNPCNCFDVCCYDYCCCLTTAVANVITLLLLLLLLLQLFLLSLSL
jgi:hypothetical protein